MATYSSNITTKFSGVQVAFSATGTAGSVSYTVPAGKTLVGGWSLTNPTSGSGIGIDGVTIAILNTNGSYMSGPLYANAGSVVSASSGATNCYASFHGVLMENTP